MGKQQAIHVKIGDNVTVISGFDKNKTGEVTKIYRNTGKILVKGVNFKFKILLVIVFMTNVLKLKLKWFLKHDKCHFCYTAVLFS